MSGTDWTTTPNLSLYKPVYDADAETWGTHLNANADTLDAVLATSGPTARFLPLAGGTMAGGIALPSDPSTALGAATKQYVDAHSFTDAAHDGTAYGRLNGAWSSVLPIAGGTLTGALTLAGDPSASGMAATKNYVDTQAGVGKFLPLAGGIMTGLLTLSGNATASLNPVSLQQLNAAIAANGVSSWNTRIGAVTLSTADVVAVGGLHDVGRNLLHNSLFNVQQRGAGQWTAGGWTADRWAYTRVGAGTNAINIPAASDAGRAGIGDEAVSYWFANNWTGSAATTDYQTLQQTVEDVRRLSGKTVTVSFWAQAASAIRLGLSINQSFGTGGSPSAPVTGIGAQSFALTTTWTRYIATIALPSIIGKTLGTNSDHGTQLFLWFSAGSGVNTTGVGVQSGIMNIWGVQLEIGSAATPLEKPDPQVDLAKCQRFYQTGTISIGGYGIAGTSVFAGTLLPVVMRAVPTTAANYTTQTNCTTTGAVAGVSASSVAPYANVTATGNYQCVGTFTASADL